MYHSFSVLETFKTAWHIVKKNFVTIIIYSAIAVILLLVIQMLNFFLDATSNFGVKIFLFFLLLIMQGYTTLGLYKLIFTLIDSEYYEFEFNQIVPSFKMVTSFISISLLFAFVITTYNVFITDKLLAHYPVIKTMAEVVEVLIVLYLALRYMFCVCFIVDDDSGPIESLRQSFHLTKDNIGKIILILLISIVLIAIGFTAFVIGIIVTYPLVNIVLVVTYRKLVYSQKDVDDEITETL